MPGLDAGLDFEHLAEVNQKGKAGPPPHGFTTYERGQGGRLQCDLNGGQRWGPWRSLATEAGFRDMECHSSGGEGA